MGRKASAEQNSQVANQLNRSELIADRDRLLQAKSAAVVLDVSHRTLEGWRSRGFGPPYLIVSGRSVRYRVKDLLKWIEALPSYPGSRPAETNQG